jgi:hypothetical protein
LVTELLSLSLLSLWILSLSKRQFQQAASQVKNIDRYTHKFVSAHVEINSALAQIFGRNTPDLSWIFLFNRLASDLLSPPYLGRLRDPAHDDPATVGQR